MFAVIDRLRKLTVADVMVTSVVQITSGHTMGQVAGQFRSHDISSAPVVDEQGRCVGMLSAADYLKRDIPHPAAGEQASEAHGVLAAGGETGQSRETVACFMTSPIRSIAANASLLEAGRLMCTAHIHRLPVLDGEEVVGVVSTTDIVAAMLDAVDELDANRPVEF